MNKPSCSLINHMKTQTHKVECQFHNQEAKLLQVINMPMNGKLVLFSIPQDFISNCFNKGNFKIKKKKSTQLSCRIPRICKVQHNLDEKVCHNTQASGEKVFSLSITLVAKGPRLFPLSCLVAANECLFFTFFVNNLLIL